MPNPSERPQGVFIHRLDGEIIPCELAWVGVIEGINTWAIATQIELGDQVKIEVMPSQTAITVPTAFEES